jgi:sugar O-acyltransferase (sialic acid O-acetyltransferase NeuD family)
MSVTSKRALVIIGAGGFGAIAAWAADDINAAAIQGNHLALWDVVGYADCDSTKQGTCHAGRAVLGTIEDVARDSDGRELWFFCAIGDNDSRAKMVRRAEKFGWKPATLVHPSAVLASSAEIGPGTYVGPAAVISFNAKIGAHVIIDVHVSVGHDAVVKDFSAVFPGARITGRCRLGEHSMVGSNATLLPGTIVGNHAVVGAGSLAHGSVEPDTTIFGIPARVIFRRRNSLAHR